jgi:hypothetical protein
MSNLELFAFVANVVIQEMKGQRNYEWFIKVWFSGH